MTDLRLSDPAEGFVGAQRQGGALGFGEDNTIAFDAAHGMAGAVVGFDGEVDADEEAVGFGWIRHVRVDGAGEQAESDEEG